jgi:hypothetical protein
MLLLFHIIDDLSWSKEHFKLFEVLFERPWDIRSEFGG